MFSTQDKQDNCIPICPYFCQHKLSLFAAELEEPKIAIWGQLNLLEREQNFGEKGENADYDPFSTFFAISSSLT